MAVSDQSRYRLHQQLERLLGGDGAATLMAYLPPVGWADVATRADLDQLEGRLRSDMSALGTQLRSEMSELSGELRSDILREMNRQTWRLVWLLTPSLLAVAGLAVAAPHL